mmetsp:Transcript_33501/g.61431  ORF Transcript_33501/g.61431 Transcript_33501/m.61431 type:complete len:275 (-) Transcript_33501:82-906(-)
MGCDFELVIQGRFQGKWHALYVGDTKTKCGGGKPCHAMREYARRKPESGKHHAGEECMCLSPEHLPKRRAEVLEEIARCEEKLNSSKKGATLKDSEDEAQAQKRLERYQRLFNALEANLMVDDHMADFQCLLYSVEDFEGYVDTLRELEEASAPHEPHECNRMLYTRILRHVPTWARMLSTAGPVNRSDWMGEEEEETNAVYEDIRSKQQSRALEWQGNLSLMLRRLNLPACVVHQIAVLSLPSVEVRIAWKDYEGQSEQVRDGDLSMIDCLFM